MDNIIKDIVNPTEVSSASSDLNNNLFLFRDEQMEEKYRLKYIDLHRNRDCSLLTIQLLAHIINLVNDMNSKNQNKNNLDLFLSSTMISIHSLFILVIAKSPSLSLKGLKLCYSALALLIILEGIVQVVITNESFHFVNSVLFLFSLIHISINLEDWILNSLIATVVTSLFAFSTVRASQVNNAQNQIYAQLSETYIYLFIIWYFTAFSVTQVWMNIRLEKKLREDFFAESGLETQTRRVNEILSILVPKFVKELMQRDIFTLSEVHSDTSILFCDICNFDEIVAALGENIVTALDKIFRNFDQLCIHHGIQKIETVGKTYMACAGLQACEYDFELQGKNQIPSPKRILSLAFDMMYSVKDYYWGEGNPFILKIGLHVGTVLAGVIGFHKPQFSLIGDTVNTASRVCSTGIDGKITISEVFYSDVKDEERYQFYRKEVEAKGKGLLINYQVELTDFYSPLQTMNSKIPKLMTLFNNPGKDYPDADLPFENDSPSLLEVMQVPKDQEIMMRNRLSLMENGNTLKDIQDIFKQMEIMPHMLPQVNSVERQLTFLERKDDPAEEGLVESVALRRMASSVVSPIARVSRKERYEMCQDVSFNEENTINFSDSGTKTSLNKPLRSSKSLRDMRQSKMNGDINNLAQSQKTASDLKEFTIRFNKYWLTPQDQSSAYIMHSEFKAKELKKPNLESRMTLVVLSLSACFHFLVFSAQFNDFIEGVVLRASCFTCLLLVAAVFLCSHSNYKFLIVVFLFVVYVALASLFFFRFQPLNNHEYFFQVELVFSYSIFSSLSFFSFVETLVLSLLFLMNWLAWHLVFGYFDERMSELVYVLIFLSMTIIKKYMNFLMRITMYNTKKINMIKKSQQTNLISHFLPAHILESFLVNPLLKNEFIDNFDNVTILFADIAKFTSYSSKVTPSEVLSMLKLLFTDFDQSCLHHNIYKLYTIGDCYVAIGFIDPRQRNPPQEAKNMVLMAQTMIETIKGVQHRLQGSQVNMRIGIHTGQIYGGIVGTDIVRYDIYGPDVLIANKCESNGREGFINISKSTKELLQAKFPREFMFQKNKEFTVKSIKRSVETYFVYKNTDD